MGSGTDHMGFARSQSQFGLYCVMSANLLMTGNLTALKPFASDVWGNAEAISVLTAALL